LPTCTIENNGVRTRVASASFAATLLLLAGCGTKHPHPTLENDLVVAQARAPWQKVIDDWYDGRIDRRHSCRAVREAINHLPVLTYSGARGDLAAYARKVC
jgi:hypothetical protein